ncbi:MAG: FKBP-type peptidyl-prolyl cis-trans isomerase [Lachnospiraceae bacterium]|nr:FKBP-type peptidyl-prolyl cis-trans isomerase [Lachnospiraceae bacterium]
MSDKNEGMSLSKSRKLQRQAEIQKQKRNAALTKVVLVVIILAIVAIIGWVIYSNIQKKANEVIANEDYSSALNNDGTIKNFNALDAVNLCDYSAIKVAKADVEFTDEDVDAEIQEMLENDQHLDTETTAAAADGDKVSIDYVGTMDGVAFEGGTANDSTITIGSGSLIDTFEQQIIGHVVGDNFDVNVTFPDYYPQNADFQGKPAVFNVTLKGIYTTPEFTDEYVAEHLSENASTVEEYKQYLKDTHYKDNLAHEVQDYIAENCTAKSYPKDYIKSLKANYKYNDQMYFQYMNSMYSSTSGTIMYADFADYIAKNYDGMTEEEYDLSLEDKVKESAEYYMFIQAIAQKEGITADMNDVRAQILEAGDTEENINSYISNYGEPYLVQSALATKVVEKLSASAIVE